MSNLTDLLPAGAGGKQVDFVASGTIGNGSRVSLNSDGTISVTGQTNNPDNLGSATAYDTPATYQASCYDVQNNKVVLIYDVGTSQYDSYEIVLGTVSGTLISFGTPFAFLSGQAGDVPPDVTYIGNGRVLFVWNYAGNNGVSRVGTISGSSMTFGSSFNFTTGGLNDLTVTTLADDRVAVAYRDNPTLSGSVKIGNVDVSGNISWGSRKNIGGNNAQNVQIITVAPEKFVVFAYDQQGTGYSFARTGAVTGTNVSFGTLTYFTSVPALYMGAAYLGNDKIAVGYVDLANSRVGKITGATVNATTFSFGNTTQFTSGSDSVFEDHGAIRITSPENGKFALAWANISGATYTGKIRSGAISGNNLSLNSVSSLYTNSSWGSLSATYVSNFNSVFGYSLTSASYQGNAKVFTNSNTTTNYTDFIGITDAAISDTASGSVTIKGGISTNVTGLTPNQNYYVQVDGTLSTTASDVLAGKALSSTSINLDYTT